MSLLQFFGYKQKVKNTTVFKQLILNVIVPVVVALVTLAVLSYRQTKKQLELSSQTKNYIISDEILRMMELQDGLLDMLSEKLDARLTAFSDIIVNEHMPTVTDPTKLDLLALRKQLGMNEKNEDIYIIDENGIVVNTTFEKDLHLNFFNFGKEHEDHLKDVFRKGTFTVERFALEKSTKRLKKYSYQPTQDGKYIIELGAYSIKADEVIEFVDETLENISSKEADIVSINLYVGEDNPFSLNYGVELTEKEKEYLRQRFQKKDTNSFIEKLNGAPLLHEYIFIERKNTKLYKNAILKIVTNKSRDVRILRNELIKSFIISFITIFIVVMIIFNKTRVITSPIKRLVQNVNRIAEGNLDSRADVEGNNEIATLSEHFNLMLERIERYYNELEQKVQERTKEIREQKVEIEEQRDDLAEKNEKLEHAYVKIETQNKHITDSIHYAKRIQTAILPPDHYVHKVIPESFVLYLPKDIVSGDFYWVHELDHKSYFAAVDCTGHGVPGAFMSIVGNDHLHNAVKVAGARKPSQILDFLNAGVTNTLRQQEGTVRDGMDISLCCLDRKNKKLEFAGAKNPLYLVRNGEIIVVKGDRFPIGAFLGEELKPFQNHVIDVEEGDMVYIFSDGYPDQFGGEQKKKFMYKRFRETLVEISQKSIEEQKVRLSFLLNDWRGALPQIDDVLVIGVRV